MKKSNLYIPNPPTIDCKRHTRTSRRKSRTVRRINYTLPHLRCGKVRPLNGGVQVSTCSWLITTPFKPSPLLMRGRGLQIFSNITMFIYPHPFGDTGWAHIFLRGIYRPCLIILNVVQRVYNLSPLEVSLYYNRQVYIPIPLRIE